MATRAPTWVDAGLTVVAAFAMLLGLAVAGYGLLLVSVSPLGGAHVTAVGVTLFLAGLFATEWAGDQFDLEAAVRRRVSLGFAALALLLALAFVVLNYATFSEASVESTETVLQALLS